jgi:hypothetical protein
MELAASTAMLPTGTVMCNDCDDGPKLLCPRCCASQHRRKPLHRIKVSRTKTELITGGLDERQQVWESGWQTSTLGEQGLIHHLGHGGQPCLWPLETIEMTVITPHGFQRVYLVLCGCCDFEGGERGVWQQILASGWYRAGLIHPRVCSSFRVLSAEYEQDLMPSPRS